MSNDRFMERAVRKLGSIVLRSKWARVRIENFVGIKKRREQPSFVNQPLLKILPSIIVWVMLGTILWFLSSHIAHYFSWPQSAYRNPVLYNLTTEEIKWDVFYGHSPSCGSIDCHLTTAYPRDKFLKQMVLPAREFPLKDFKKGDLIYLRSTLKIPDRLLRLQDTIVLHTLYMWAERYTFYVNEKLISEGGNRQVNIPIPREMIASDGTVNLAFRIDPGKLIYQGLANNAYLVIGSSTDMQKLAFAADEIKTTYYLWFLLPTVTLGVIFIFLFLFVSEKPGSFAFICYSFSTAASIFLSSGYPESMLPWHVVWERFANVAQVCASIYLWHFIADFFYEREHYFRWHRMGMVGALFGGCLLGYLFLPSTWMPHIMDVLVIFSREGAVIYGLALCAMSTFAYAELKAKDPDTGTNTSAFLLVFFAISFMIVSLWFGIRAAGLILGPGHVPLVVLKFSFNLSNVFDLAFFVTLAAINFMEVGVSMARKERIEQELLDAANIARAFQPDAKPDWQNIGIDIFHKPLTEASGDWFAFNQSKSGRFCHYILCDITGHGIQAALVVSSAKAVLGQLLMNSEEILEGATFIPTYMRSLGRILFQQGKGYHTLTMLGISFDMQTQTLYYISAGHPFPLLVHSAQGNLVIKPLVSRSKLLGSTLEPEVGTMQATAFPPEAQLVCYTDGIPLKMSQGALKQTFRSSSKDNQGLSAALLFSTTWAEERQRSGRRPDDDTSIVIFTNLQKVTDQAA